MKRSKETFMEEREAEAEEKEYASERKRHEDLLYEQCNAKSHPLERTEQEKEDEAAGAEYPLRNN